MQTSVTRTAYVDIVKTEYEKDEICAYRAIGAIVTQKSVIGKVGNTGNAKGKPAHLHYSISSIVPQGDWHQDPKFLLFFINPIKEMER